MIVRYYRGWDWEDEVAAGAMALVVVVALVILAILLTLIVATVAELARIYARHAFTQTPTARALWLALGGLLLVWLVAGLLTTVGLAAPAAYLAAWGFLAYVIVAEACDLQASRTA